MQLAEEEISCILLAHCEGYPSAAGTLPPFLSLGVLLSQMPLPSCPQPGCLQCWHCSEGVWGLDLECTVLLFPNVTLRHEMQSIIYFLNYYYYIILIL